MKLKKKKWFRSLLKKFPKNKGFTHSTILEIDGPDVQKTNIRRISTMDFTSRIKIFGSLMLSSLVTVSERGSHAGN